ncbi:hypothetical protein [Hyphomonas sp.]|uniref:hypothetical protein n=1 Tax=Hyphomonas sp. TaxID=87 RepID=UPI000C8E6544|nr:hypothetical protein [Hyphomonas sp.]MAL47297.1 hypothetical protein [Hyphomonas sp.]
MGYRSDVGIIVAFKTREDMEKVIATYKMNPDVQRLDLFAEWSIYHREKSPPQDWGKNELCEVFFLQYKNTDVKWYDEHADVQGIRHLTQVANNFGEEQGMYHAWKELNVGEDGAIHQDEGSWEGGNNTFELSNFCDSMLEVSHPEIQFGTEYSGNMDIIGEIPNGEKEKVDG